MTITDEQLDALEMLMDSESILNGELIITCDMLRGLIEEIRLRRAASACQSAAYRAWWDEYNKTETHQ